MARIRTIKPEFTQSERIGRLSRDARLLFIQIWTIVDDEGRARASSRGLASALYPFDDDVRDLIDGWLCELQRERLITRYEVDGSTYLEVNNWRKHQKIDRPTASRLPGFDEASRVIDEHSTSPRVVPDADLGPSTLDRGPGIVERERARDEPRPANRSRMPWPPDAVVPEDWITKAAQQRRMAGLPEIDLGVAARMFANHYAADTQNPRTMTEFQAKWNNWALKEKPANGTRPGAKSQLDQLADIIAADKGISV